MKDNPGLQSVPADEDSEEAAHGNEVPRGRARATVGDRFHFGKARQVQVLLSVSSGRYLLRVGGSLPR